MWATQRTSGCHRSLKTMTQPIASHGHNHLPDEVNVSVVKACAEMVKENRDRPSLVYANAVSNLHEETMANLPNVDICKRTIHNQRDAEFPPVPHQLNELRIEREWAETLTNTRSLLFDSGQHVPSRIILFATDNQLRKPTESDTWMIEGNFSMAPHHFTQLYAIRVPLGETSVPVAFAFSTDQTQHTRNFSMY